MMTWNENRNASTSPSQEEINTLAFVFPEVHRHARLEVQLRRTLRVPNDGKAYSSPTGFETFNLKPDSTKDATLQLPMFPSDAMWLNFVSPSGYPFAVQVQLDEQCAVSGRTFTEGLTVGKRCSEEGSFDLQNFLVIPEQKTLDGYRLNEGAVNLSQYILEGEEEKPRILKLWVYPLKEAAYQDMLFGSNFHQARGNNLNSFGTRWGKFHEFSTDAESYKVKKGAGLVSELICPNERPLSHWDGEAARLVTVELIPMRQWLLQNTKVLGPLSVTSTGWSLVPTIERPKTHTAYTKSMYNRLGYPWFDHYDMVNFPLTEEKPEVKVAQEVKDVFQPSEVAEKLTKVEAETTETVEAKVEEEGKDEISVPEKETQQVALVGSQPSGWWEKDQEKPREQQTIAAVRMDSLGSTFTFGMTGNGQTAYTQPMNPLPQVTKVEIIQRVEVIEKPKKSKSLWKRLLGL